MSRGAKLARLLSHTYTSITSTSSSAGFAPSRLTETEEEDVEDSDYGSDDGWGIGE